MWAERQGYTLFEIIVVMAIIPVAAAVAIPTIRSMFADALVKAAADQVKSQGRARAKAMEEGKPYRFSVTDNNKFRVGLDDDFDGPNGMDDTLPCDVSFGQADGNAGTSARRRWCSCSTAPPPPTSTCPDPQGGKRRDAETEQDHRQHDDQLAVTR